MKISFGQILSQIIVFHSLVVTSRARCPSPEIVYPCTCTESTYDLICIKYNTTDFNTDYNLTHILDIISKNITEETDRTFNDIVIANTQSLQFNDNLFSEIKFQKLFLVEQNLTKIDANIFAKTYPFVTDIYMNLFTLRDQQKNSLFSALSSLPVLKTLHLDFGHQSIIEIPDNAFEPLKGVQTELVEITVNGMIARIGDNAFTHLPHLKRLKILNQIQTIGDNSLVMNTTDDVMTIDLSDNKITSDGIETNSLVNIGRPVHIILNRNHIKYLDQTVFESFFNANQLNTVSLTGNPLDCRSCRSYWVTNQNQQLASRLIDAICENGKTLWEYKWECIDATDATPNQCPQMSIILSLFILLKMYFN